jgi:hypothetical protein
VALLCLVGLVDLEAVVPVFLVVAALGHPVREIQVEQAGLHLHMAAVAAVAHLPLAGCNLEQLLVLAALAQHHQLQDHQ